ncbi:uncharacterized protein LOC111315672 [Durio zibethinus]|uniref:Uncharacterized protein LOC111315672 n=1 Tax=Durio zibethinus TaxID=66656 RepID=A0A6P6B815_DURZI|nr:uncharacterized protein LOC111315672 [Durio zibethinus]
MYWVSILVAMDLSWRMEPITSLFQIFMMLILETRNSHLFLIGQSGTKAAKKLKRIQKIMLARKIVIVKIQKMARDICASVLMVSRVTLTSPMVAKILMNVTH